MTAASITNTAIATATDPQLPPPGSITEQDDDTNTLVLPDLVIDKSHSGNFFQGQVGATFSIVVTNAGNAPTIGTVTVTDTLPAGLTATGIAGPGWTCGQPIGPCSRSDALAALASYPAITLTVDVAANAGTPLVNSTTVSGGGEQNTSNNTDTDSVTIDNGPDPTITKTHVGNFFQGQVGAAFTITVTNNGGVATVGTITVTDALPAGLTATSISGIGWTCAPPGGPCTHPGPLAPAASLPVLTLIVDVAANAGSPLVNQATVSGGGDVNPANNTASDPVTVAGGIDLTIAKSHTGNFFQGQVGATFTITVTNVGGGPSSGTITVSDTLPAGLVATAISGSGWTCAQPQGTCTHPGPLAPAASLPALTLTVDVATNAGSPLVNSTTVSGGGDTNPANNTATDSVTVDVRRIDIAATPVCINDIPYVNYVVTPVGFTPGANPTTVEWVDSNGVVRQTVLNQPLSGQLLWPGTTVVGGVATDWPGWEFVGGQWVQVNDGLRPTMTLRMTVNPTSETIVTYPPPTPFCSANPPRGGSIAPVPVQSPWVLALMALLVALFGAGFARARAKR